MTIIKANIISHHPSMDAGKSHFVAETATHMYYRIVPFPGRSFPRGDAASAMVGKTVTVEDRGDFGWLYNGKIKPSR